MHYLESVALRVSEGGLTPQIGALISRFYDSYSVALQNNGIDVDSLRLRLDQFLTCVCDELAGPYQFEVYHEAIRHPFDYYTFGLDFFRPLVAFSHSRLLGMANLSRIVMQVNAGENVILFANHQTEPDPQLISLMLEKEYPRFAAEIIFVAGHRVTSDPMAIPFSKGRNLLCIFSKRHLTQDGEGKAAKLLHNKRALNKMKDLLSEGGKCIYVAPGGGRDRCNEQGIIELAPFDPSGIELFALMAAKSAKPVHFYPLALSTYSILPPLDAVKSTLGETRVTKCTPIRLSFGGEINMDHLKGKNTPENQKSGRSEAIWQLVKQGYTSLSL